MKKLRLSAFALALVAMISVGSMAAFAAEAPAAPANTTISAKTTAGLPGVKAVAAEVLGVTEESIADLNTSNELYAELEAADKVDEFKAAFIEAKQTWLNEKAAGGKFSAEKLEQIKGVYSETVNSWDGTTELFAGKFGAKPYSKTAVK